MAIFRRNLAILLVILLAGGTIPANAQGGTQIVYYTQDIINTFSIPATGTDNYQGESAWVSNGTGKIEVWLDLTPFGAPPVWGPTGIMINEIQSIRWRTNKPTTGADFYIGIYANPWGTGRLQAEPLYAYNLSEPTDTWNIFSHAAGTNQLSFHDSSPAGGSAIGFYNGPTWANILAGPINWCSYPGATPGCQTVDYTAKEVLGINISTGNPWAVGFLGALDWVELTIAGKTVRYDFVGAAPTAASPVVPDCNNDGRENSICWEPWATAVIYCANHALDIYRVNDDSTGTLVVRATQDTINAVGVPAENVLIASSEDSSIRLYRLDTGEFQVNAPREDDPNGYVFTWEGCGF